MARSRQSHLVERNVALISSRGASVHGYELKVRQCVQLSVAAANSGTVAQQFRCNYDMKNRYGGCHRATLV